tara:strand:- start:119 stop:538 length:420 start_codon:yes stop_codon:yes gene_type:complete
MYRSNTYIEKTKPAAQNIEEEVHDNINDLIKDKPLALAIEHLKIFLENSNHAQLYLKESHGYNQKTKLSLIGIRAETPAEVQARLDSHINSLKRDVEREKERVEEQKRALEERVLAHQNRLQQLENFKKSLSNTDFPAD